MTIRKTGWDCSYSDYLAWQGGKSVLPEIATAMNAERSSRVAWFRQRFEPLAGSRAVCLGARYGEEVEALRLLGWSAMGVDVHPFPPFVEAGDMNHPSGTFDLVFTNSFDHCWEPAEFLSNISASLNSGGLFLLHLSDSPPGEWETWAWDYLSDVLLEVERAGMTIGRVERFPAFYDLHVEVLAVKP